MIRAISVAVELDDGGLHLDLCHGCQSLGRGLVRALRSGGRKAATIMASTPAGKPGDAASGAGLAALRTVFRRCRRPSRRRAAARVINSPGGQARASGAYGNVFELSPTVTVVLHFVAELSHAKPTKTKAWKFLPIC